MRKELFLSLLFLIVISGCVSQPVRVDKNNGLVINEFSLEPSRISSGEDFVAYLEVENVGGTTATNAKAEILNVNWLEGTPDEPDQKWSYGVRFLPPNLEYKTPGDVRTTDWNLKGPLLPEGIEHDYDLKARVTFTYKTSGAINILSLERNEYYRRLQKDETFGELKVTNTFAPVQINAVGPYPTVIDADSDENEFTYILEFINVGDGVPITYNTDGLILGHIKLYGPAHFSDCMGIGSGQDIELGTTGDTTIKLRRGESIKKGCTISIDMNAWGNKVEDTLTLVFDLEYDYYVEKYATLTVIGKR
jgi:hypothetical protein